MRLGLEVRVITWWVALASCRSLVCLAFRSRALRMSLTRSPAGSSAYRPTLGAFFCFFCFCCFFCCFLLGFLCCCFRLACLWWLLLLCAEAFAWARRTSMFLLLLSLMARASSAAPAPSSAASACAAASASAARAAYAATCGSDAAWSASHLHRVAGQLRLGFVALKPHAFWHLVRDG